MILYDWLLYASGKPDPAEYGGESMVMVSEHPEHIPYNGATALWGPAAGPNAPPFGVSNNANPCPDQAAVDAALAAVPADYSGLIVFDIESWQSFGGTQPAGEIARDKYIQLAQQGKIARPLAKIGFYNVLPLIANPGYYNASQGVGNIPGLRAYNDWFLPIAPHVDVIMPSAYFNRSSGVGTGTSRKYRSATLDFAFEEAGRCYPDKPAIPFLSPYYLNTFPSGRLISGPVWRGLLEDLDARGVKQAVLWGGKLSEPFDYNAEWYRETLRFQASRARVHFGGVA